MIADHLRRRSAVALLLLSAACADADDAPAVGRPVPVEREYRGELRAVAREFAGALLPAQVRRVRSRAAQLVPAILDGLADPDPGTFANCAELAAKLRLTAALPHLRTVLDDVDSPFRALAFAASERIRPLPLEDVLTMLTADRECCLAALEVLRARGDAPFGVLLPLLGNEDPVVVRAAAMALPAPSGPEQIEAMADLDLSAFDAPQVVAALGRRELPHRVVESWLRRAESGEAELQFAILRIVAAQRPPLPADLLHRLFDSGSPAVRFEALRCLILLRKVDVAWLTARSDEVPSSHRLLCALGLLQENEPAGARILYRLAFDAGVAAGDELPHLDGEDETELTVALCARQILSRLADLPLHGDPASFEAWHDEPRIARPEALIVAIAETPFVL